MKRSLVVCAFVFLVFFVSVMAGVVEEKEEIKKSEGYVTFWFDDGLLSTYEVAFPALEEKKWNAVVAVVVDREEALIKFESEGDSIMEWSQVEELVIAGWEVSNHSMTHPHLNEITSKNLLRFEIEESKKKLEERGFTVSSFTFPYGEEGSVEAKNLVKENYSYWRSTASAVNSVPSGPYLTTLFVTECMSKEDLERWIKEAQEEKGWLVITLHSVIENPVGWWQQTPEQFKMILEMVEESSLEVVLPGEMFNRFPKQD